MRHNKTATTLPGHQRHTLLLPVLQAGMPLSSILLADDDTEDCDIFIEVVHHIKPGLPVNLVHNGEQLMRLLHDTHEDELPGLVFLDLNMPLKNGQECLTEIRTNKKFKAVPVVVYSTSSSRQHIDDTFLNGANFYFPKPDSYNDLKVIVSRIFALDWKQFMQPQKDKFVISINHFK